MVPTETPPETRAAPSPEAATARFRRRRRGRVVTAAVAAAVGVLAVAGAVVRLPYVLVSPGSAAAVEDVVEIEGVPTYEHDGSILFLTVSVSSSRPNLYTLLNGWLDGDVEVLTEDEVFGDRSRREERELNQAAMTASQIVATQVSLERLGYSVPVVAYEVRGIENGSPAAGEFEIGDMITAVDGVPVTMVPDLGETVRERPAGDPVTFEIVRDDEPLTLTVTTRAAPDGDHAGEAQVGILSSPEYDFPVDVQIDTGEIGGPSAGLAFTLTILDELSPGDLTGGEDVAVTGTISSDGTVGPIGGVEQKAVAASRAGAAIFLVPEAEAGEARRHGNGMTVVAVGDLDDALAALERHGGDPLGEAAEAAA